MVHRGNIRTRLREAETLQNACGSFFRMYFSLTTVLRGPNVTGCITHRRGATIGTRDEQARFHLIQGIRVLTLSVLLNSILYYSRRK